MNMDMSNVNSGLPNVIECSEFGSDHSSKKDPGRDELKLQKDGSNI
jgi:hypothetical protein